MYLFNIKKLKSSIQAGQFTEADRFKYLLLFLLIDAAAYEYVSTFARPEPELWDYLLILCSVVLLGCGTYAAYLANGAATGRDFVARFFAVSLVVTNRLILLTFPLLLLWLYYTIAVVEQIDTAEGAGFDLLFPLLWGLLLYYRIYRHMADLKDAPMAQGPQ